MRYFSNSLGKSRITAPDKGGFVENRHPNSWVRQNPARRNEGHLPHFDLILTEATR